MVNVVIAAKGYKKVKSDFEISHVLCALYMNMYYVHVHVHVQCTALAYMHDNQITLVTRPVGSGCSLLNGWKVIGKSKVDPEFSPWGGGGLKVTILIELSKNKQETKLFP